eukprot:365086-Chlamydomonas_euryale.AAC.13
MVHGGAVAHVAWWSSAVWCMVHGGAVLHGRHATKYKAQNDGLQAIYKTGSQAVKVGRGDSELAAQARQPR